MKKYFLIFISFFLISNSEAQNKFHMPAEWEAQEAVWFGSVSGPIRGKILVDVIKSILPHVQVKVSYDSEKKLNYTKDFLSQNNIDISRIKFTYVRGEGYWLRDHGSTFLTNDMGELAVADFDWNEYGSYAWMAEKCRHNKDSLKKHQREIIKSGEGSVDSLMAIQEGAKIFKSGIVQEGGSIEVNGKGTLILCEAVVFQRNPGKTKTEIEAEYKRVLGVSNIIWMKQGLADDPHLTRLISGKYYGHGTGGHTDEFVRFANQNTILLAWVDEEEKDQNPINQINFQRMNENLKILEAARDEKGRPFTIIKVPLPDPIIKNLIVREKLNKEDSLSISASNFIPSEAPTGGDTIKKVAASSYLNYMITNGVIILPTYTHIGSSLEKENKVKKIFKEQFPDRELVFINCMPLNWVGGGIHCATQQQPKRLRK